MPRRVVPASTLVPSAMVTGRSVFSRSGDARDAERGGLFLDAARVGEHEAGCRIACSISRYDSGSTASRPRVGRAPSERASQTRRVGEVERVDALRACADGAAGARACRRRSRRACRGSRASDSRLVDVRGPVQRAQAEAARRAAPARRAAGARRARASRQRRSESIIGLPTKRMRSAGTPSASRLASASRQVVKQMSESASVTMRLTSSGIVRSRLRRPASTCATSGRGTVGRRRSTSWR